MMKPIPGFSRYSAGDDGHIYRWYPGRARKAGADGHWRRLRGNADGTVSLKGDDGKRVMTSIAKQILRAWVGPQPIGYEPLRYPDPNLSNTRPDNLRWAPKGSSKVGDSRLSEASRRKQVVNRAFSDEEVSIILNMHAKGVTAVEIAEQFEVGSRTIYLILRGKSYQHVPRPEGLPANRYAKGSGHTLATLTPKKVRKIRALAAEGLSRRTIATQLGCSAGAVRRVLDGTAWTHVK